MSALYPWFSGEGGRSLGSTRCAPPSAQPAVGPTGTESAGLPAEKEIYPVCGPSAPKGTWWPHAQLLAAAGQHIPREVGSRFKFWLLTCSLRCLSLYHS